MGWAFVAALTFGLYGSLIHPLIGLVGFVVTLAIAYVRKTEREKEAQKDWEALEGRLRDRLNEKWEELLYTFRLTVRTSPLGIRDYRRFDKEVLRFLEAGIAPGDQITLTHNNTSLRDIYETCFREHLLSNLESHQAGQGSATPSYKSTSPLDFERHCAERFRSLGWQVTETPASGDQGVDLIAKWDGQIIAVQCKFYSQPVGNSAVQEVAAGKVHYGANMAAVISTGGYTSSASALAKSNGVLLLHPDDIPGLGGRAVHFAQTERYSGRHLDWPPRR